MSFSLFATCIDGQHKHLIAESFGDTTDEGRAIDGRGVDADLIRTPTKQGIDVFRGTYAAADSQWNKNLFGGAAHHIDHGLPMGA